MPQAFFCIPGDLQSPTGGYAYDRRLLDLIGAHDVDLRHLQLPGAWPAPSDADIAATAAAIAVTPRDAILLIDGLAYGAMPADLVRGSKRRIVALIHHPLGLENGLSEEHARGLIESEKAALALANAVIVTSRITARTLIDDFAVPPVKLFVAEPGVDSAPRALGSGQGEPLRLLAAGSLVPRKGYDILINALAACADLSWRMTIAGSDAFSPETVAQVRALIAKYGLANRVALPGALPREKLHAEYSRADIFVMSSLYEGYGMVVTEALARGLPIVSTTGGALSETVPDDVGLKVQSGDVDALGQALRTMILDSKLRRRCRAAAWARAATLPRWEDTASKVADVLKRIAREAKS